MTVDIEAVVIGAGVVGLATAVELASARQEVMVLERHDMFGTETSSRNSEVIHAGLYYPQGSLRARLCVEGKTRLYAFAAEYNVPVNRCGKLLVATTTAEIDQLAAIEAKAARNGVCDLQRLTAADVRELEPELNSVAATLSPSTGIIDSHLYMAALETRLLDHGGQIAFNSDVMAIRPRASGGFDLTVRSGGETSELSCCRLVIAGGLGAVRLGRMLGSYKSGYAVPDLYPAKGHYFALSGRSPFRRLIYPMPSPDALGIHVTLDMSGAVKFGPDIAWLNDIDYSFADADTRRMTFAKEIKRYWPGLPEDALMPAYTGIRPKIYGQNAPPADFAIHGEEEHGHRGLVALYGIESPGLTSSLAIAAHVARLLRLQSQPAAVLVTQTRKE